MTTAEEPPPLPIHTLLPFLFNPPFYQQLFHASTPSPYPSILYCSSSLFVSLTSLNFNSNSSLFFFTHYTPFYLHMFHCHMLHTRFHCSYPPILSRHMLPSNNSFPQHALLTAVPYSMSMCVIHTSMLAEEYCSLNFSLSYGLIPSSHNPCK